MHGGIGVLIENDEILSENCQAARTAEEVVLEQHLAFEPHCGWCVLRPRRSDCVVLVIAADQDRQHCGCRADRRLHVTVDQGGGAGWDGSVQLPLDL
jgi:hypothetical protein